MNKKSVVFLFGILMCLTAASQSFIGYGYDNYSGVNGVLLNPATLADSKYKVNVNILAVSAYAGTNTYELDRSKLFGLHFSNLSEGNGYYKAPNTDYKYAYFNTDILGPSAMVSLTPKDAFGIVTRMRTVGNEYNLSNSLFQLLGNPNPDFYNTNIINRSLQMKVNAFAEVGVSYGRVLMKDDHSELKIGITGKYIAGLAYGSVSTGPMTVNIDPQNNIEQLTGNVTAQFSSNLDNLGSGGSDGFRDALNDRSGNGWGLDLGLIYELKASGDPTQDKLRLGFSITDLGQMKYNNSPDGATYSMNVDGHNTSELEKQSNETFNDYFNRLKTNGLITAISGTNTAVVKLPTAVHLNADYEIYKRLYINADILLNMLATSNPVSPNYITTVTVTPRLEKKWFSIYSPVSYNAEGQVNWGAGVRLGPLFVGSGSVLSSLMKQKIQTADAHVGLTIPIFQHGKTKEDKHKKTDTVYQKGMFSDRDGDGVVDAKDECPDSAGPIKLLGCPDRDGDGVPDIKDSCPDVPGSVNFHGCPAPDTDGDSVNDDDDKCPLVKGVKSNYGCPPINPVLITRVNHAAERIFFVRAKATIEDISLPELDRVVAILQSDSTLRLRIEGYTDSEGTDERELKLSTRRAEAVERYMMKQGIAVTRLDFIGYGKAKPIATNDTDEGRAKNRRVEMVLMNYPKDKPRVAPTTK
jgi:outer membrane protein OmpA-like peptidoglycan-associated protein